jgi:hypothetical protein
MGWHNTGCNVVHNLTSEAWNVRKEENKNETFYVGPKEARSWEGTIFPWCANSDEIRLKAFLFFRGLVGGTPVFYMFQKWPHNDTIYWTFYNNGVPSFEQAKFGGAGVSSYVDVIIKEDSTPEAVGV